MQKKEEEPLRFHKSKDCGAYVVSMFKVQKPKKHRNKTTFKQGKEKNLKVQKISTVDDSSKNRILKSTNCDQKITHLSKKKLGSIENHSLSACNKQSMNNESPSNHESSPKKPVNTKQIRFSVSMLGSPS